MCGLVGLRLNEGNAQEWAVNLLLRLQHRGQDGAGVTVWSPPGILETVRGLGLIESALKEWVHLPDGPVAIAHTRYATTGTGGVGEIQPFVKGSPRIALAHNGNIVNVEELTEKFQLKLETASDLDVLQQVFLNPAVTQKKPEVIRALTQENFIESVQTVFDEFNGSYAVVGIEDNGTLFGFRDPFGIRPLFFATFAKGYALASETSALAPLDPTEIQEIEPGGWIRISSEGITRGCLVSKKNTQSQERFCMFEVIYFSSPQSEIKNESIYRLRFRLGVQLAKEIEQATPSVDRARDLFDYVVPVPETSRTAAIAVAETLAVPYREFLVKNPYVPRTFILNKQEERVKALKSKLSLIGPEIKGKRVLLVDDSVVRGNTSRLMCERLREAGAKSVSIASTCPPIRYGCYYGIDFPDPEELVASGRDIPQIAANLKVDGLYYLSIPGLVRALRNEKLCMACLDGNYPTRDQSFEAFLNSRRMQRKDGKTDVTK